MKLFFWLIPILFIIPIGIYLLSNPSGDENSIKKVLRQDCEKIGYKFNDANLKEIKIEKNLAFAESLVCFPPGIQAGEGYAAFLKKTDSSWQVFLHTQPPLDESQIGSLKKENFPKDWYKNLTF